MADEKISFKGKVIDTLPDAKFKVQIDNGRVVLCHLGGKLRQHNIRVLLGDIVDVQVSVYDLERGIINYRYK